MPSESFAQHDEGFFMFDGPFPLAALDCQPDQWLTNAHVTLDKLCEVSSKSQELRHTVYVGQSQ